MRCRLISPSLTGLILGSTLIFPALAAHIPRSSVAENSDLKPNNETARRRAPEIFNAVHHAMRQWGSSLHHNGMSFFVATVPEGVIFHHGTHQPEPPTEPEWLAYEIEHAENFARPWRRRPPGQDPPPGQGPKPPPGGDRPDFGRGGPQVIMSGGETEYGGRETMEEDPHQTGYLHIYQTTRPMQFLYMDGMGAGKTQMGTLDSQDYLLRGIDPQADNNDDGKRRPGRPGGGFMDERERAADLCALCKQWDLQGVIRMEAGFEIIKCDFSDGLRQLDAMQRPSDGNGWAPGIREIEYLRSVSERYQGIGSSRTHIDFSSMVSAFFFPVNLTNPNPHRPDLPRLSYVTKDELTSMRDYVGLVVGQKRAQSSRTVDWQDVSDLIVGRYADRIKFMAEEIDSVDVMAREINVLLTLFIDHSVKKIDTSAAMDRCTNFYLRTVSPTTEADRLIETAFRTVAREICTVLFRVRNLVVVDPAPDQSSLAASTSALRALMEFLRWTRFKRCPTCSVGEVCVIPMWPMGTVEQYKTPACTNGSDAMDGVHYWTATMLD